MHLPTRPHRGTLARACWPMVALAMLALACGQALAQATPRIGMLEITGTPADAPNPLAWLFGQGEPTLNELVEAIGQAREAHDLDRLVVRLKDAALSWAQVDELGQAIASAGLPVTVFAEQMGPAELMLASYADQAVMQAAGDVSLPGLYMEELFLGDTLAWIGLRAQLIQIGDYKGANEQLTRSAPSDAWNQNIEGLLDGLYGHMLGTLAKGRDLAPERIEAAMQTLWMAQAQQAVQAGLIDHAVDLPELGKLLVGQDAKPRWVTLEPGAAAATLDTSNPFAFFQMLGRQPKTELTGPTIAVLHLTGPIVVGDSGVGGLFGGQTIGSRSVRNELKSLADNDLVKGVVLRIDSPGGSATASEIIWQGVRDLAQRKPVWVSVGSMAASGGYYIAVAGQKIYANPSSILGSIGVVGGKISMDGLYDTLRVGVVGRARGPHADMFATHKPWNDQQIELVRQKMRQTYEQFTGRVRQGRPGIDLSTTAEGRLFLGRAAVERKMADRVGSLHDAVADMAQQLGLEQYDVRHYPGPKSLAEFLEDAFGSMVSARAPAGGRGALAGALGRALPRSDGAGLMGLPMVQLLREAMGPQAFGQVAGALEALGQLRHEPVVLTAPSVLTVRSPR